MKILFVTDNYYPYIGGAETLWKNLCEGLVKKGNKVAVVTNNSTKEKKWFEIINDVSVTRVNAFNRYSYALQAFKEIWNYAKLCDIIVTSTYASALPARIVGLLLRKPVVLVVHEIIGKMWAKLQGMDIVSATAHQFAEWCIIQLGFDKYVGVSDSTVSQINQYWHKAVRIYNGIDYSHFNYTKPPLRCVYSSFVYLYYGRAGYSKGVEYLVDAIPMISDTLVDSKCVLILGKEPKERYDRIKEQIASERISRHVLLHDSVPYADLPSYLRGADCIVVPSVTEGFGYSVAESCAVGVPVVASNTHSIPEVISDKYVLVNPCDAKAIANAVIEVSQGKYYHTPLKKFTWDTCVSSYDELLRRAIG